MPPRPAARGRRGAGHALARAALAAFMLLTAGCSALPQGSAPLPAGFASTAAVQTLVAQGVIAPAATGPVSVTGAITPTLVLPAQASGPVVVASPALTITLSSPLTPAATRTRPATRTVKPTATHTPTVTATPTASPTIDPVALSTALAATLLAAGPPVSPTPTPAPPLPDAPVQIYRLGEQSMVVSPLEVNTYAVVPEARVARIELYGEDGRLLARHLRTARASGNEFVRMGVSLDFEISAAAEAGRLVVSMEDRYGRLVVVNSVNLVLLSAGDNQINPATALRQRIIIQEPALNGLIVGGKLIVTGRALANNPGQPLRVMLYDQDGRLLGSRLAGIEIVIPGDYGLFTAEVPYSVSDITPALLVVYEEGNPVSEIAHLSSLDVILAP